MSTATAPQTLWNGIAPPLNSFVLPEHKIVYMSVTKVACTSLRWMVADLAGEDLDSFRAAGGQQNSLMGIHGRRHRWQKTPQLSSLPADELARISPENGWFIFAVVRDPYSRLWSGWESKFLVRHVRYMEMYSHLPWFPRVPSSAEQVLEDWRAFVHARPWETDHQLHPDVHFRSQVHSARPESVNYSKIYDLSKLSTLFDDIHAHLEPRGLDQPLYTPRANETPLPMIPAVLEGGVREVIEDAYADDFRAFGDRWSIDDLKMADGWSPDAIEHAAYHTVANDRIGDLSRETQRLRRQLRRTRQQLREREAGQDGDRGHGSDVATPVGSRLADLRALGGRLLDSEPAHRVARTPWVRHALPDGVLAAARSAARRRR